MKILSIYDDGGLTLDRYTVLTNNKYFNKESKFIECLSLAEYPNDFAQWGGCIEGPHLGKRIQFERLSGRLQNYIAQAVFSQGMLA